MYKVYVTCKQCDFNCSYAAADVSSLRTCILDALEIFNLDKVTIHIRKEDEKKK